MTRQITADSAHVTPDEWLTGVLHKPTYKLDVPAAVTNTDAATRAVLTSNDAFVYAKVPTASPGQSAFLESLGFHLVEASLTFTKKAPAWSAGQSSTRVRPAAGSDRAAVADVARRGFSHSRFHVDPAIPDAVAHEVKAAWVESYFDGNRGTQMLVAELGARVAGFVLLILVGAELIIDLIAVDAPARGQGIGHSLLVGAEAVAPEGTLLRAGTQSANIPSVRMYEAAGFRLDAAGYTFHKHGDSP